MAYSYQLDGLGTAVREVGGSGRSFTILGAALGSPPAELNTYPDIAIAQSVSQLNLASVPVNTEAILALIHLYNFAYGEGVSVVWNWYRDRDSKLIFQFTYTLPSLPSNSNYTKVMPYSYIGFLSASIRGWDEIQENGSYHVDVSVNGTKVATFPFTVIGVSQVISKRTSITMVDAPSQAKPGDIVHVNCNIQSLYTGGQQYVGVYVGLPLPVGSVGVNASPGYALLSYGQIQYFQYSFTMPDVSVLDYMIYSWWWNGTTWIRDDQYPIQILKQAPAITTVTVTVTNTSTQGGTPVPVWLDIHTVFSYLDTQIGEKFYNDVFSAGEVRIIKYTINSPPGPFDVWVTVRSENSQGDVLTRVSKLITP